MLSKNQVSHIRALHQKKQRELRREFIAEGSKLVLDLLNSSFEVTEIYATADWIHENHISRSKTKVIPFEVSQDDLARITAMTTPGPVLAIVDIPETDNILQQTENSLILLLDAIRDPGNLGTIIRIADWFGISAVVCSENTVELYNPKVVQATMGSIARVPVFYRNLGQFLQDLPSDPHIFGTFLEGENIYRADLPASGMIIIGSEANGISEGIAKYVTRRLNIPPFPQHANTQQQAESLNVSVATAIICSEFRRRT